MNFVLFGIQGSGKGTQAKIIAEKYKLKIFETGEALRNLAHEDSELGHKVKTLVESGNLVSANIIVEIIENFLSKLPENQDILFDGFPRNLEQEKLFDEMMKKHHRDFMAINLNLPQEETVKRLLARGRHDDVPEIITKRIRIFFQDTTPIIDHYRAQSKVVDINGFQTIDNVSIEIFSKIDQYFVK
jgi:adenylate kinase